MSAIKNWSNTVATVSSDHLLWALEVFEDECTEWGFCCIPTDTGTVLLVFGVTVTEEVLQ